MDFTFIDAVDFLFNVHKLFNLPYNPKVKSFMFFLECFVYKMTGARRFVPQRYQAIGTQMTEFAA